MKIDDLSGQSGGGLPLEGLRSLDLTWVLAARSRRECLVIWAPT